MAKPQEKGIQTMVQLFDAGYRYLVPVPMTSVTEMAGLRAALGPVEKILGRNFTVRDTTYLGEFAGNIMGLIDAIAKNRACTEIQSGDPFYNNFNIDPITRQFSMKTYRCFLLRKDQAVEVKHVASFKLYFSERAGRIWTGLRESGIDSFWYLARVDNSKQPQSIALDSHIQIVFFLLLIGLSIGLVSFGLDSFLVPISIWVAKWKSDKRKNGNKDIVLNSLGTLDYRIIKVESKPRKIEFSYLP